jgi:hypothetical protein
MEHMVPISFIAGLFTWLVLRRRYRTQQVIQVAAIERGLATVPPVAASDSRKTAWVLMALGVGFSIATYVSVSAVPHHGLDAPLAVSVWGIVPVLVGVALWAHHRRLHRAPADAATPAATPQA